jgi:choline dehydrogenase-like flavoprotein
MYVLVLLFIANAKRDAAGPGGGVVGNRLSEDGTKNVLIIEAGIKYAFLFNIRSRSD